MGRSFRLYFEVVLLIGVGEVRDDAKTRGRSAFRSAKVCGDVISVDASKTEYNGLSVFNRVP
jgi:hypothetical protein